VFSHPSQYRLKSCQERLAATPHVLEAGALEEIGYSLIELLVVILILGVLSAIAIPSFLSQQTKGYDAQAKSLARSAETTAEAIASEHDGLYQEVTEKSINAEEPAIPIVASKHEAYLSKVISSASEYKITTKATNGDELTIHRNAAGEISRECVSPSTKTGCDGGETSSW